MTQIKLALFLMLSLTEARAVTGKVIFVGTEIDSGNAFDETSVGAKVFDGDFTTAWGAASTGQWVGIDAGAAVTLSSYWISPRIDNDACAASCWDRGLGLNVFEGSNSSDFTGAVTINTLGKFPMLIQYVMNPRAISPAAFRYYRVRSPSGYGDVAELRMIGDYVGGVNAQPVSPVISPWGGVALTGSQSVTITSQTTSAVIRYTIDGSTPTCSTGTVYSGGFVLTVSTSTTVNAIACEATLSTPGSSVVSATFRNYAWAPDTAWPDIVTGIPANVYGGGIIFAAGKYYHSGNWMYAGACQGQNPCSNIGVWLYSSTDLYNWQLESQILDSGASGGRAWTQITRPHIIYNALTSKYVMWAHCNDNVIDPEQNKACIATADVITGPWTWSNLSHDAGGDGYKDCNLFVDDDGVTAYTVFTGKSQNKIWIFQLAADYLSVTGSGAVAVPSEYEGPVMFRRGSTYFLVFGTSTLFGQTTVTSYSSASSPLGTWTSPTLLFPSGAPTGHGGQPTNIYKVPGKVDAFIYGADLYSDPVSDSTLQRDPISFPTTTTMAVVPQSSWDLSFWADSEPTAPTVTSTAASSIGITSATAGGNVTSEGGDAVTARGTCLSTTADPTTDDTCTSNGTGTGAFSSSLSGLTAATLYHIRAFATNAVGTSYGIDRTFTTSSLPPPASMISGRVTISGKSQIQ